MKTIRRTRRRLPTKAGESRQLNESDILDAALRLIRRDGAEKLSMRTLATELGVTPMAIYHYVPNKAALVQKLGDSVLVDLPMPPPTGARWAGEFKAFALEGWQRLAAHPGLTDLLLKQPPSSVYRRLMRYGTSILVAGGFDQHSAGLAITSYNMFMFGVMSTQAQLSQMRAANGSKRRPAKTPDRVREYLGALDFRELVEYQIEVIVAGLRAQAPEADRTLSQAKRPADRAAAK